METKSEDKVKRFGGIPNIRILLESMPAPVIAVIENDIVYMNDKCKNMLGIYGMDFVGMSVGEALNCREPLLMGHVCGTGEGCRFCGLRHSLKSAVSCGKSETQCGVVRYDGIAVFVKAVVTKFQPAGDDCMLICFDEVSRNRVTELAAKHFASLAADYSARMRNAAASGAEKEYFEKEALLFQAKTGSFNMVLNAIKENPAPRITEISSKELEKEIKDIYLRNYENAELFIPGDFKLKGDRQAILAICDAALTFFGNIAPEGEKIRIYLENSGANISLTVKCGVFLGEDYITSRLKADDPGKPEYAQSAWLYCIWTLTKKYLGGEVNFTTGNDTDTYIAVSFKSR